MCYGPAAVWNPSNPKHVTLDSIFVINFLGSGSRAPYPNLALDQVTMLGITITFCTR